LSKQVKLVKKKCSVEINFNVVIHLRNEPSTPSHLIALHSEQLRVRLSLAHASHWTLFRSFEDQLSGLQNVYSTISPTVQSLLFRNVVNKANVVCMGCEPLYLK